MDNIVLKIVAKAYGVSVSDILSISKKGKIPEARKMVVLFLNTPTAKPTQIAYAINRTRTTLYNSLSKITFQLAHYKDVQQKFKDIQMTLIKYLETTKTDLENWLTNNPCLDQKVREQKLDRLADVNETHKYITNLKIN
jgi:hypothetical protein